MTRLLPFFLLITALLALVALAGYFTLDPLKETEEFAFPAYALRGPQGDLTLIDQSQRRVMHLDPTGNCLFQILGGTHEPTGFFYTQEIAYDPAGQLILLNQVLDAQGFFLVREEIQLYDRRGKYLKTIYQVDLDKKSHRMVQRCWSRSLKIVDDQLLWFELDPAGLIPYRYNLHEKDAKPVSGELIPVPNAHLELADVDWFGPDSIVYTLKSGKILRRKIASEEPPTILYDADQSTRPRPGDVPPIPWELEVDRNSVFFVDLTNRTLCKIQSDGTVTEIASGFHSDIYRFSASHGFLTCCCENSVLCFQEDNGSPSGSFDHARPGLVQRSLQIAFWVFVLIALASLLWSLRVLYVDVFHRQPPRGLIQATGVLIVVILTLAASLPLVIGRMVDRQQELLLHRLNQMIQTIPATIDARQIERLDTAADYQSEDYRKLRAHLYSIYNENKDPWNAGWYFVLYRVRQDRIHGLMYRNELIGPFHPFTWGEQVDADYIRTMKEGAVLTAIQNDAMGTWIYGLGPVRNEQGEIVAVFETGTDLYAMMQGNRKLVLDVLLDALTLLVVIVLCLFEFLFFANLRTKHATSGATAEISTTETFLTRPAAFLFFAAVSFPVAFVPLMMKTLYHSVPGFSEEMVLASPISVQMLCFGIGTFLAGWGVARLGIKPILHAGFACAALGLLLGIVSTQMLIFLCATAFLGLGTGMTFIGIRSALLLEPDQEQREWGYSYFYAGMTAGVNVGLVFGAALADRIGFHHVFTAALAALFCAWIFNLRYTPTQTPQKSNNEISNTEQKQTPFGLARFISKPLVAAFLILHVFPIYAIAAYIYYFFPIFAQSQGVGTGNIGRLLILNGLMIIYVGPVLGPFLLRKVGGKNAFMLGQLTWALGTGLLFACCPTVPAAVLAIILFGIAEGVVAAGDMSYYLQLNPVKRFGEERAIAVFELVGKLGETAGPILFALALAFGLQTGMFLLGLGTAATLLLLAVIEKICRNTENETVS